MIGKVWLSMSSAPDNQEPAMMNITFATPDQYMIRNVAPRVEFANEVPTDFIHKFLRYMAKNQIRVIDKDGNKLDVRIY